MNRSNHSEIESGNSAININIAEMSLPLMHENIFNFRCKIWYTCLSNENKPKPSISTNFLKFWHYFTLRAHTEVMLHDHRQFTMWNTILSAPLSAHMLSINKMYINGFIIFRQLATRTLRHYRPSSDNVWESSGLCSWTTKNNEQACLKLSKGTQFLHNQRPVDSALFIPQHFIRKQTPPPPVHSD